MSALPWITHTERVVGKSHPSLADVANRPLRQLLSESGYDPDANPVSGLYGPVFNIRAYGGIPGGADTTPARNAATAAAVAAGGGVVWYPPGFWYHLTQPEILVGTQSIIYQGSGRNCTSIVLGADGIDLFSLGEAATRIQLRDMWIGSFVARPSGRGLAAVSSGTAISGLILSRVTFQNLPGAIHLDNVAQSSFNDVWYSQTITGATVGVVWNMIRCNGGVSIDEFIAQAVTGTLPSDVLRLDSDCDSVFVHKAQLVNLGDGASTVGVRLRNSVGGSSTGPRLCRFTDCQVENAGASGWVIESCRGGVIQGGHAANNGGQGLFQSGGDGLTVIGGSYYNNQQHGISITGGVGTELASNTCTNNSQQTDNTYSGIFLATVTAPRVHHNKSSDFFISPVNRQKLGIYVDSSVVDARITDNDVRGNLTDGIQDLSTTTYKRGNFQTTGAQQGTAVLVAGTVTVATTEVKAGDRIILSRSTTGGTVGHLSVGTIVAGTSFIINSSSGTDTSTVFWEIVH